MKKMLVRLGPNAWYMISITYYVRKIILDGPRLKTFESWLIKF